MLQLQTPLVLQLSDGQLLRWTQAMAVTLRVIAGRVWVTRTGDLDDHFLDAGDQLRLEEATILRSVRKTGRLLVVHEAAAPCGVGAEVAAIVSEKAFAALKAPVRRITGPDAPAPSSWMLEQAALPQADGIARAALELLGAEAVPA